MQLTGVNILIELSNDLPGRIGDQIRGKVIIATNRKLAFYGLKLHLFWRVNVGGFLHAEEIGHLRLAGRTDVEPAERKVYDFTFPTRIERSTFVAQQLRAEYELEARITPVRSRMEKLPGDHYNMFSKSYVETARAFSVRAPLFTYRVQPRTLTDKGVDLWWLGSAGGWLAATVMGATPALAVAFGALALSSMVYAGRMHYLQETPMRITEGSDNGIRIIFYTTSDARVLDGYVYYQIKDVRLDREQAKQVTLTPMMEVGGPIRKHGRMTDEGFEVTLPWPTKPLPAPAHIGASHYKWKLIIRPSAELSLIKETRSLNVRLISGESLKRFRGNRET